MKNPYPFLLLVFLLPFKNQAQNIYGIADKYFVSFNPYTDEADTLIEFEGPPYINGGFRSAIDRFNGRYFFGGAIPGHTGSFHIIDLNTLEIESYPVYPENIEYDFMHDKLVYEKYGSFYSLDLNTMMVTDLGEIENGNSVIYGQVRTYVPQRNEYVYVDYPGLIPDGPYYVVIDAATGDIVCEELAEINSGVYFIGHGLVTNDYTGEIMCHYNETFGFLEPCQSQITKLSDIPTYDAHLNTQLCVYDHFTHLYIVPFVTYDEDYPNFYAVVDPYANEVLEIKDHPFDGAMDQHQMYDKPVAPLIELNDTLFVPRGKHYTWYRDGLPIGETSGNENFWIPTASGLYKAEVEFSAYSTISTPLQITTVGIAEGTYNKAMYLYPNPVVDELNIEVQTDDVKRIAITAMTGQTVYAMNHEKDNNEYSPIDIRALPQGTYTVTAFTRGATFAKRFVKL